MKPLIGITSSIDATDSGAQKEFLNDSYVQAVERASGLPLSFRIRRTRRFRSRS